MTSVTVQEFADEVMRYLNSVREGEEIVVTEGGHPIARLIRDSDGESPDREALERLAAEGLVTLPSGERDRDVPPPIEAPGTPLSEIVIEDRG